MRFYQTADEYVRILEAITEAETDEEREGLTFDLESIDGDFVDRAEDICGYVLELDVERKRMEAQKKVFNAEAEKYLRKEQSLQREIDKTEKYLREQMEKLGMTEATFGVRNAKIKIGPPRVKLIEGATVPPEYCKPAEPKKKEILEELKAGAVFDFAEIDRGKSVTIK